MVVYLVAGSCRLRANFPTLQQPLSSSSNYLGIKYSTTPAFSSGIISGLWSYCQRYRLWLLLLSNFQDAMPCPELPQSRSSIVFPTHGNVDNTTPDLCSTTLAKMLWRCVSILLIIITANVLYPAKSARSKSSLRRSPEQAADYHSFIREQV